MAMNKKVKKRWINALLSKEYRQGHHTLHNTINDTYCCLGVLTDLAVKDGVDLKIDESSVTGKTRYDNTHNYLPEKVMEWAGLDSDNPVIHPQGGTKDNLANRNDKGASFESIAELIKEHL